MLNGDDTKPKEEEKTIDEIEESINKDRIIKLDEVETMSQIEVNCEKLILNKEFQLFKLYLEKTNES